MSVRGIIPQKKLETVKLLVENLQNYNTIGLVEMGSIGAKTVQKLRSDLRKRARIVVAKNTLMRKALEESSIPGNAELAKQVRGSVAFLFTNDSPYVIANYLDKNKVKAPAKAGQIAPKTVTVPKMNTGFPPGTIISELNSAGLPTRIEGGTVAIPSDTVVVEEGGRISTTLASILSRLGIEPFEVGLSLNVVLENGELIYHDDLIVDFDEIRDNLMLAHKLAVNLSIDNAIITDDTVGQIIGSAHRKALSVAAEAGYISPDSASHVFASVNAKALALLRAIINVDNSAVPSELAELVA